VFTVRQIQEKCREEGLVFIDFIKTHDSLNHDGLWQEINKFGCPN